MEGLKKNKGKWPSAKGERAWLEHWTGILIIITVGSSGHHSLFSVDGKYYIVAEGGVNKRVRTRRKN